MKFCVKYHEVFTPISLTITFENLLEIEQLRRIIGSTNIELNKLIKVKDYELIPAANDKWVDNFARKLDNIHKGEYPID